MIKTFVINMEKDVEKRNKILSQLDITNLDYEIVKACEGRKLTEEQLKTLGYDLFVAKNGNVAGSLPAFGCSVSHYSVYKRIVSENIDYALILEDDVILSKNLSENLTELINILREQVEPTVILLTPEFRYCKENIIKRIYGSVICRVSGGYMTTGYLVNLQGAKLLGERLFPIRYVADDWNGFMKIGLNVFGVIPHLVSYTGELGEIGKSIRHADESILLKIRHFLGRNKAKITNAIAYIQGYRKSKRIW